MTLTSFYPVLCTDRLKESRDFYVGLFGFRADLRGGLVREPAPPDPPHYELALVDYSHPTVPRGYRSRSRG
jgi:catechol 2,3-dioxygenase-like lactoylglutathione lyase family enzyme